MTPPTSPPGTRRRPGHPAVRGQALTEFALVVPVLFMLVFGIIDFGRVFLTYAMASNAVRDSLRLAETIGYVLTPGTTPPYADCELMRSVAARVFFVDNSNITITHTRVAVDGTTTPFVCSTSIDSRLLPNGTLELDNGDILSISVDRPVALITPFLSGLVPSIPVRISGQRTIITEIPLHGVTDETDPDRDTDYDGLRDLWEEEHFGDDNGSVDADELYQTGTDDPDGDGCNNGCEESRGTDPNNPDSDGDGISDGDESYTLITNPGDVDSDGDGLDDPDEVTAGSDPWLPDTDGDTLTDGDEVHTHGTSPIKPDTDDDLLTDDQELLVWFTNPLSPHSDADTLTDYQDAITYGTDPLNPDTDGDGVDDDDEVNGYTVSVNGSNVEYTTDPNVADEDGDGLDDSDERDGWTSTVNGVPVTYYPNPHGADADGDGMNDAAEKAAGTNPNSADTDGDSLSDDYEVANPPQNALQADSADDDLDGLPDLWEEGYFGTNYANPGYGAGDDADGDGCDNICEYRNGLNPTVADTDGDGLSDGQEVDSHDSTGDGVSDTYSFPYGTLPKNSDTDADGLLDGQEVTLGTSPTDTDSDNDGRSDGQEVTGYSGLVTSNGSSSSQSYTSNPLVADSDGDGFGDLEEYNRGLNPQSADTDGDSLTDLAEVSTHHTLPADDDSDDDGLKDGVETTGYTAAGQFCQSNPNSSDSDGDYRTDGNEYTSGRNPCLAELPKITINDVTVAENGTTATVTVTLTDPIGTPVTVNYATSDVSATAGSDYTAVGGTLTFSADVPPAASQTRTISVPIRVDGLDEEDETFHVNLSGATGASIQDNQALVTVTDDDSEPGISVNNVTVKENEGPARFTVTLSAPSGRTVTVRYGTADISARDGVSGDYIQASGTLTFDPGETTQTIDVTINDDAAIESTAETFLLVLWSPTNASLDDWLGLGTINDNDGKYYVSIAAETPSGVNENAAAGIVRFVVSLDRANAGPDAVTVTATTSNGTALAGTDYTATTGTVTVASGQQSATFDVSIINDTWDDSMSTDTFSVTLSSPSSNAQLEAPTSATGTIIDDESAPSVSINDAAIRHDDEGTTSFTVSLNRASENTVNVPFSMVERSSTNVGPNAVQGTHYNILTASPLVFSPGSTSDSIVLDPIYGGNGNPGPWRFHIQLGTPTNAVLGTDTKGDGVICQKNGACP